MCVRILMFASVHASRLCLFVYVVLCVRDSRMRMFLQLAKETNTVTVQRTSDRKSKKQINQYVSVKTLGRGNFGVVKMVKSISDNTRYVSALCAVLLLCSIA